MNTLSGVRSCFRITSFSGGCHGYQPLREVQHASPFVFSSCILHAHDHILGAHIPHASVTINVSPWDGMQRKLRDLGGYEHAPDHLAQEHAHEHVCRQSSSELLYKKVVVITIFKNVCPKWSLMNFKNANVSPIYSAIIHTSPTPYTHQKKPPKIVLA